MRKELLLVLVILACVLAGLSSFGSATTYTAIGTKTLDADAFPATALKAGTSVTSGSTYDYYLSWPTSYDIVLLLNVTNVNLVTYESAVLSILAGDNPPAFRSSLGDLDLDVAGNGSWIIGPLESARFINDSGYLNVQATNITACTITALKVP